MCLILAASYDAHHPDGSNRSLLVQTPMAYLHSDKIKLGTIDAFRRYEEQCNISHHCAIPEATENVVLPRQQLSTLDGGGVFFNLTGRNYDERQPFHGHPL